MMRDFMVLLGAVACLAVSSMGQDAGNDARLSIRRVIEDQQAAWNRQDLEGFMSRLLEFAGADVFFRSA